MKSKFLRMISALLILASLVSLFAVFAAAETSTEEGEGDENEIPELQVLYNRTFDEGWDIKNGITFGNEGSVITFEHETTKEYDYNYYWRFEVQTNANTYLQYEFGGNETLGSVFEFDIKSDDWSTIPNFMHFGTVGSTSSARNNYNLINIVDNKLYTYTVTNPEKDVNDGAAVTQQTEPFATLSNSWTHVAIVFDYTYDHDGNLETEEGTYFQYSIYVGDTEEYRSTGTLNHVVTNVGRGKGGTARGLNLIRLGVGSNCPVEYWGSSVCVDNVQSYNYSNRYGQVDPECTDKGTKVNLNYPKTIEILSGGGVSNKTNSDYLAECYALKLGVDYAYSGKNYYDLPDKNDRTSLRTPILTNKDGQVYGAPFEDDNGVIWVALDPILEHAGYPSYKHEDGIFIDISTGTSSSFISTQSSTATVGGKRVELNSVPSYVTDADGNEYLAVNLYDVEIILQDYYVDYDPLGLIVISQSSDPNIINRDIDLDTMMDIMENFVFEYATPEEILEDVKTNTNDFTHPYIHANQDKFDELRAIYLAEEGDESYDPLLKEYLESLVWNGYYYYELYSKKDENGGYDEYVGLMSMDEQLAYFRERFGWSESSALSNYISNYGLEQPYYSSALGGNGNGYDTAGGRSNASGRTTRLQSMAFAYQITRDPNLLYAMYDIAIELGEWTHWGPGHFLNCADATSPFAAFLDWTYNAYVELYEQGETKYDVTRLEEILWVKGVREGVLSSLGVYTDFNSPPVGSGGSLYPDRANNWNAVCSAGMIIGALVLLGSDIVEYEYEGANKGVTELPAVADQLGKYGTGYTDVAHQSAWLISSNIKTLMMNGMAQYAPDGDYIESPGYWDYGTSNFFELCSAMQTAAGTTYNMMNCWGIENTCYFAAHTESSDFNTFNFHDGSMGQQNTEWFMFVGQYFGDTNLPKIRMSHLENGKGVSMFDLLYYPLEELPEAQVSFDYYSKALDLYCARSSWDKGALYVGMMGGINKLGHGQIDAGSFVYHNAGTVWFVDLGTEEYNAAGFWGEDTRYRYYVMKPEGNNTVTLTSDPMNVPYGQILTSTAHSIAYESNEHGSYMVLDMAPTIGTNASSWTRGMMVTNDRKTTVIQDEIYFNGVQSAYWFAHYRIGSSSSYLDKVVLSSDGRTAYMYDHKGNVLRVKIVSSRADLRFEIMDTYTFVHTDEKTGTFGPEYSKETPNAAGQKVPEHSRSQYNKLAIKIERTASVTFAVVIEQIDASTAGNADKQIDVGYTFTSLSQWEPYADTRDVIVDTDEQEIRKSPVLSSIASNVNRAGSILEGDRAFTSDLPELYRYLTDVYYVRIRFYADELGRYLNDLKKFDEYKAIYDEFIGTINDRTNQSKKLSYSLIGL